MSINKSPLKTAHLAIVRSARTVGLATFCSRLLGFIRDIVIARLFGVYIYAQAFVIAFKIPNLLRDFVGEGATNAAFVPVFTEYTVKRTREEFWELANVVLNLLLVILMGIVLIGTFLSPLIVRLIAPGFMADPEKLSTTIRLTRIIFPYVLLISLTAYSMGILNSLRHFAVPAFAPCLLNISIIVFTLLFKGGIKGLATGVLVGGVMQLAIQTPVLYKKGFRPALFKKFKHPAARLIGKLMLPRMLSSCIYQLNNFADSIFGSLVGIVGEGGVAILYFAYRLILFPLGIFSTALSQVILPTFSAQALEKNHDQLKQTLAFGLRSNFFVTIPAAVGLIVLAQPIIHTLFGGGRFDAYSVRTTASVLSFYSIGLFAYGATKVMQSCFFALKDTRTPTKVAFLAFVINVILNAILMFPLKISGLALATSVSGINTFLILFFVLKKRLYPFGVDAIRDSFLRIFMASLCMGLVCFLTNGISANKYINLSLCVSSGIFSYAVFCFVFRVSEIRVLLRWLAKKRRR